VNGATNDLKLDMAVVELPMSNAPESIRETAFEKRRGISNVEIRPGFTQVHVTGLSAPLMPVQLSILKSVSDAGISIDFLKLTQDGLSFLAPENVATVLEGLLTKLNVQFSVRASRHIVQVHAVNMRDEEGLIADILKHAIGSGVAVDHVTDMHDRVLMVVDASDSERLQSNLLKLVPGGTL
jgi:aspartokinase